MPTWLGGWEWIILAVIALAIFGGNRLANAGKNAGKAIREFKEETSSLKTADPPAVAAPGTPTVTEPEGVVHEGEIVPDPKDKGQQA
ncbi:MAG: twin-arginine translocase TatA/TatE family subunit [Micropruina sp.]|nr:twin-arginine translocase TatA/TatE family subunit [Micropruina sp.]